MSPIGEIELGRNQRRRKHGFTLLELIVVLAIVSLTASMVIPVSSAMQYEAMARGSARTLAADLRWLRQQALSLQQDTSLEIDLTARRYSRSVDKVERTMPPQVDMAYAPIENVPLSTPSAIRFFADGTSTGGTVQFRSSTRSYIVSVTWPFGRVRYQE